jgi:hypothetical protein
LAADAIIDADRSLDGESSARPYVLLVSGVRTSCASSVPEARAEDALTMRLGPRHPRTRRVSNDSSELQVRGER